MICDNCTASKIIKDSWGCCGDRLHNAWEDCKHEFCKLAKIDYEPKYQCRFADLVEEQRKEIGCYNGRK